MRRVRACAGAFAAGAGVAQGAMAPAAMGQGEVIYDTLRFADELIYDGGNGNAYSGIGIFGALYDLQLCDDFVTTERSVVTQVTADYVSFFGRTPADGLQVGVFADLGGEPAEDALFSMTVPVSRASDWHDAHFGLLGVRLTADVHIPLEPNTSYYLMIQPTDTTAEGDWYYQIHDNDSRIGGDRYSRSGPHDPNGNYWWRSGGDLGFGVGDVGMQVRAVPAGAGAWVLAGAGAWGARRRRRA